jgi:hypothetical protein
VTDLDKPLATMDSKELIAKATVLVNQAQIVMKRLNRVIDERGAP